MPQSPASHVEQLLTTAQIDALLREVALFSPNARARGARYALAGRVGALRINGHTFGASVRGSDIYATEWVWDGQRWDCDCTCPVAPQCKHAFAVAHRLLAESHAADRFPFARLSRLGLGGLLATPRAQPAPSWEQRPTAPARVALIEKLRTAPDQWSREQHFRNLVQRAVGRGLYAHAAPFPEILAEPDPDVRCWRLAQELSRHPPEWFPEALEPYRDRPDLAARYTDGHRAALAEELVQWAERQRATAQRRLRLVLEFTRGGDGRIAIALEARLTTPRLTDAPRTAAQLQQLRNEAQRSPDAFAPEQIMLLALLEDAHPTVDYLEHRGTRYSLNGTSLRLLLSHLADSPLVTWAAEIEADLAARGGVTPGGSVRASLLPARLLPTYVTRDGGAWIDLTVHLPDGQQRALGDVVYLRGPQEWSRQHPSFVLADGTFFTVVQEPPAELLTRFEHAGGLPITPTNRTRIVGQLASHLPHFQSTIATHTRFHDVRALVALDLPNDDWLRVRLFAHAGETDWTPSAGFENRVVFEYESDARWVRRAASAPAAAATPADYARIINELATVSSNGPIRPEGATSEAPSIATDDIWFEAPAPERVAPVLEWLTATSAKPATHGRNDDEPETGDGQDGWWVRMSRKGMEAFADAWDQRPSEVAYFGTERVRRLLSGALRVTPMLHIESSGVDWFAVSAEWEAEGLQLSDADLAALRVATTRFVKLSSGWVRRETAEVHDEAAQLLADLGIEAGQGEQRLSLWQLAGARPESLHALARFGADAETLRAAQALRERVAAFTGLPHVPPPAGLQAELRPYQQRGLDFLAYTSSLGIGAVLADDMGLGKTVQALAWLIHLCALEPDGGPTLVVCPASVVHNWAREAARFAPGLNVLLLTSGQTRHELRGAIPSHDLIVTNYALLRRDVEAWRSVELRAVILDEAQNIKNPDAVVTRAAQALHARHRIALTGTPLENRALDLWSILHVINPGYLGNRAQFQARFDRLDAPPHLRTLLAAKLRPVLLRRTKHEVATDLPDRIEERLDCELTKDQRALYLDELRRSRALVEQLAGAPGGITQNKIHILAALTRLRQICCHPALAGGKKSVGSGKFDALFEMLEPLLAEGHKVLLFSQFVQCLKLLEAEMKQRDIASHKLTGQTVKRQEVVDAFQSDERPCVFLISLKAGGTGLNLTAASYVVLFDPWWNPAVEAQAIDRTHRIGQDHTVIAYRMLTRGTIEEKIWELQQRKAALARDILGEGGFARALTRGDLDYLLTEA